MPVLVYILLLQTLGILGTGTNCPDPLSNYPWQSNPGFHCFLAPGAAVIVSSQTDNQVGIDFNGASMSLSKVSSRLPRWLRSEYTTPAIGQARGGAIDWTPVTKLIQTDITEAILSLTDVRFESCGVSNAANNYQCACGGALSVSGEISPAPLVRLNRCLFINCWADEFGGSLYALDAVVSMSGCEFTGSKGRFGGSIALAGYGVTLEDVGSRFLLSKSNSSGGSIYSSPSSGLSLQVTEFINSSADVTGGAIFTSGRLAMHACLFVNCSAGIAGGSLYLGSNSAQLTANLTCCYFLNSSAKNEGGALVAEQRLLTFHRCAFDTCDSALARVAMTLGDTSSGPPGSTDFEECYFNPPLDFVYGPGATIDHGFGSSTGNTTPTTDQPSACSVVRLPESSLAWLVGTSQTTDSFKDSSQVGQSSSPSSNSISFNSNAPPTPPTGASSSLASVTQPPSSISALTNPPSVPLDLWPIDSYQLEFTGSTILIPNDVQLSGTLTILLDASSLQPGDRLTLFQFASLTGTFDNVQIEGTDCSVAGTLEYTRTEVIFAVDEVSCSLDPAPVLTPFKSFD